MYNSHKKYSLFIGRWQPFHSGHKYLVDQAIAQGKNVCVGIRDTEISASNPYTIKQREEMIWRIYGDKVSTCVIPDIDSINVGRNVGYDVNFVEPPADIGKISGTNVRSGKESQVPQEIVEYLNTLKTTLWLTGLPCSGKTTLAKRLKEELDNRGYNTTHLDGDDVRGKLNEDLGFSDKDRKENLRRVAHVARLFNQNHIFVVASFVSPTDELRDMVKDVVGNFKLVYIKCDLAECEKRDIKGMYKKARAGEIKDFTGISAPFEEPKSADIVIDTARRSIEDCVDEILRKLNADTKPKR